MPDATIQTPLGFAELPKADQIRYLQALWDQISEHAEEIPLPESHLELAEERLRRHQQDPSATNPAFQVIERLAKKSE
jgi:putative addiction module component (TIGR02574 family)